MRAPAKLNLSLRIVGRRSDGYHLLDSRVVPIDVFDLLEVRAREAERTWVRVSPGIAGLPPRQNLAARAARLFVTSLPFAAVVDIRLIKGIPVGAGLGGGSSDAAAVLLALNRLFRRRLSRAVLARWGLGLGADVPFFVHGSPARVRGVGERIEPRPLRVSGTLVLAFAGFPLATERVYRKYDASLTTSGRVSSIRASIRERAPQQHSFTNDLEAAAMTIHPGVRRLKERLLALGATGASMTGSGSAVFGRWSHSEHARSAVGELEREGIWARTVEILERTPEMSYA